MLLTHWLYLRRVRALPRTRLGGDDCRKGNMRPSEDSDQNGVNLIHSAIKEQSNSTSPTDEGATGHPARFVRNAARGSLLASPLPFKPCGNFFRLYAEGYAFHVRPDLARSILRQCRSSCGVCCFVRAQQIQNYSFYSSSVHLTFRSHPD